MEVDNLSWHGDCHNSASPDACLNDDVVLDQEWRREGAAAVKATVSLLKDIVITVSPERQ